jgi:hypothetical protein
LDFPSNTCEKEKQKDLLRTIEKPVSEVLPNPKKIAAIDRLPVIG